MKKLFIISILIICCQKLTSQIYYSNYLDETSEWRTLYHDGTGFGHTLTYVTRFFDGLENINGFTYYKMFQTSYLINYTDDYNNMYSPQTNDFTAFEGYLREDASGKFYLKYIGQNEIIVFDNQELLNVVLINDYDFNSSIQSSCEINSISTINLSGYNAKAIFSETLLNNFNSFNIGASAVEGIGVTKDSCFGQTGMGGLDLTTFCYTKQGQNNSLINNFSLLGIVPVNCNSFPTANRQNLNSNNYNLQNVTIYPNPTNDFINIDLGYNFKDSEINLYDLQGRLLLGTISQSKINKIDLSNYQKD